MTHCLGTFGGARVPCREGMASLAPKELHAPKAQHHLRSVSRRILVLGEAFTPIILTALQHLGYKICRSLTALNIPDFLI